MYIPRHMERAITEMAESFPIVLVSGPRQVGKTTLLQRTFPQTSYVTLDQLDIYEAAKEQPERFLDTQSKPLIIDEIQYAPELFRSLKIAVDADRSKRGQYFLTGSQKYLMMQGVDESMAGRAGILEMLGLSLREIQKDSFTEPFLPSQSYIEKRMALKPKRPQSIWEIMYKGDLPELYTDQKTHIERYYASYIETYLQRDVRSLAQVGDLMKFNRFMAILARLHGQILNKTDLASRVGASFATIDRWLSVLQASNIVHLLKPFEANSTKRLVKSPKIYFLNSGLAAYLCGLTSATEIEKSNMAGAFMEGFVLTEIIKSYLNNTGSFPALYFYRDSNRKEIDFVIESGTDLYPIEVKKSERPHTSDIATFDELDNFKGFTRKPGALICLSKNTTPLGKDSWALPLEML